LTPLTPNVLDKEPHS